MNFTLYDVTAEFEEETVSFKRSLLQKEMSKQSDALKQAQQDLVRNVIRLRSKLGAFKFYSAIRFLKRHDGQYECDVYI